MIRRRCTISGRVQGVGFRWAARAEAERLGVAGFVRNLPGGEVLAEVEGEPDAVGAMLEWLCTGPRGARVDELGSEGIDPIGETGFRIAR